ncbi:MAG: hypothetical protein HRT88_16075 [Lentisphaeraceae bacterium]|nr:hypothetical protein [Lentisphaeraceae bacterium]
MKNYREKLVKELKRVVIKVGSRLLVDENKHLSKERLQTLISQISDIRDRGVEVILVSSGAISVGMSVLGWDKRPKDLPNLQAAAATGQSKLMSLYEDASRGHGFHCAQLLLTA